MKERDLKQKVKDLKAQSKKLKKKDREQYAMKKNLK